MAPCTATARVSFVTKEAQTPPSDAAVAGSGKEPARAPSARRRSKLLPEDHLKRAMAAKSPRGRAMWAGRGLASAEELHPTTHAMLLRQMYVARFAQHQFEEAYALALQAVELDVLPDVIHQDAARAKHALGDLDSAIQHLRLATRQAPASRRAFHWWTLGSLMFVGGRYDDAEAALSRAARWGTTDKPLYRAHLALAKCRAGKPVRDLHRVIEQLEACPCARGYGRFILGHLAQHDGRPHDAARYLQLFVDRTSAEQRAKRIALSAELRIARDTLQQLRHAS